MRKALIVIAGIAYCAVSLIPWVMVESSPWRLVSAIALLPVIIPIVIFSWVGDVKLTKAAIRGIMPPAILRLWSGK